MRNAKYVKYCFFIITIARDQQIYFGATRIYIHDYIMTLFAFCNM